LPASAREPLVALLRRLSIPTQDRSLRNNPTWKGYLALVALCIFWAPTYLFIRMALESFPPLTLVATRYTLSGAIVLAVAALMRIKLPTGKELLRTSTNGVLMLGIGNGLLVIAQKWIPSGLAALFSTTVSFWLVGIDAVVPGGERLRVPTVAGLLIGFAGVAILVFHGGLAGVGGAILAGFLVRQVGCFSWAVGSIRQRHSPTNVHPMITGAVQQLASGLVFVLPSMVLEAHDSVYWSVRGTGALLYLVVFASIAGFSAYIYALSNLPVAVLSIYIYVNPVESVFLGWLIYGEPFGLREAVGMGLTFLGVAIVEWYSRKAPG
jgi:drug/metabolite transporter (DMT)-like permease